MRILSISGILPIPGLISSNDFVFQTYGSYKEQFPDDTVLIIRPTQHKTNIKKVISGNTELDLINKKKTWNILNFQVEVLPFYSSRRLRNLHSLVTHTIFVLNRKRIDKLVKEFKPDIVHAQYIFPDGLLAGILKKKYGIPYIITTHNELFYLKHYFSRLISLKILRNASHILPINFANFRHFSSIGLKNVELIPLGFDQSFLRKQKEPAHDVIRIISVAELIKLKNIEKVILALESLVNKYNITYCIVGKGPEKAHLQKMVEDRKMNSSVRFVEHVPHKEIPDELYKNDIFILPSYPETFGRVFFEAMAMGIPVICAKNSGIFGYFSEGVEGFSVDHRNTGEITALLELLITDTDKRMRVGKQGQELVKKYTWNKIASLLHEKYSETIKAKT